ncbi:hypothetical protein [Bacillus cereus]|uniref:hypothetical protein n=1 Tax=Bacillus cereus TaxID=1396 RepID=UPI00291E54DE|nr:hypothetical protein GGBNIMDK_00131 [Bacillus cereus]
MGTIETEYPYAVRQDEYRALKKSNLKECCLIRYADDFKILCRNYPTVLKMFKATKYFFKTQLHLEINNEKFPIVNL